MGATEPGKTRREVSRGFLPEEKARGLLDSEDIGRLGYDDLVRLFIADETVRPYLPSDERREDPRTGLPVYYSESRAGRPHSYGSDSSDCPICGGTVTRILDLHPLRSRVDGEYAFINKNLYPIAFPGLGSAEGLHFLIWPSSHHDRNFRNMEPDVTARVLSRIALLERLLMSGGPAGRYVCLIKNEGARVGGSIAHDHFQLLHTPAEPLEFRNDRMFMEAEGVPFQERLLLTNGRDLTVSEDGIWTVLVPRFMKRPYDLTILCRDGGKRYLHDLAYDDLVSLGKILASVFRASDALFAHLRRQPAFNLVLHDSGCGAPYFEFLPHTQELGGFERLGLYLSQTLPERAAEFYRGRFGRATQAPPYV